jgi:mRNA interferase MazF
MQIRQKEIVLLPFPFSDLEGTKVRPALVVSNDSFNAKSDDCVMVPLTTVIKDEPFSVLISQDDLSAGKLLRPSRIRADKIFTVEKKMVMMRIGSLKANTFNKVKDEIVRML